MNVACVLECMHARMITYVDLCMMYLIIIDYISNINVCVVHAMMHFKCITQPD